MENHISQQLLVFVQSILLGLAIGSLYDLLRPFRLRLPRLAPLLDGVYALAVGAGCFRFVLARAEGELRGFVVLGVVGGAVLFFSAFSSLLRPVWEFWADTLGLKMLSIRVTKGKPLVTLIFLSKEREINNESYEQRGRMGRSKQDFSDRL